MTTLVKFEAAKRALAEACSIDEVKLVRDQAEALRLYVRQQGESLKMQNDIAEIKLRAERRAGELLKEMGIRPGNPQLSHDVIIDIPPKLEDLNISPKQSSRWQLEAEVPEEVFEQHVAETKAAKEELTSVRLRRLAQELRRKERWQTTTPDLPTNKYRIIYADPPWRYSDSGVITDSDAYGRAERHYPTMSIEELCALPVKDLAEDNAVLFLWATSPMLEDAFVVVSAWGFKYKTSFVWDKVRHNFGHYNSVRHEFLLVCTRGSCTPDSDKKFDSVQSIEYSGKHSGKPEEFRQIIDTLYIHGKRIELFARSYHEGWEVWGNEI